MIGPPTPDSIRRVPRMGLPHYVRLPFCRYGGDKRPPSKSSGVLFLISSPYSVSVVHTYTGVAAVAFCHDARRKTITRFYVVPVLGDGSIQTHTQQLRGSKESHSIDKKDRGVHGPSQTSRVRSGRVRSGRVE